MSHPNYPGSKHNPGTDGDPKRFCVLIPAHPMTWNTGDNKEAVYVVPVGY